MSIQTLQNNKKLYSFYYKEDVKKRLCNMINIYDGDLLFNGILPLDVEVIILKYADKEYNYDTKLIYDIYPYLNKLSIFMDLLYKKLRKLKYSEKEISDFLFRHKDENFQRKDWLKRTYKWGADNFNKCDCWNIQLASIKELMENKYDTYRGSTILKKKLILASIIKNFNMIGLINYNRYGNTERGFDGCLHTLSKNIFDNYYYVNEIKFSEFYEVIKKFVNINKEKYNTNEYDYLLKITKIKDVKEMYKFYIKID